MSFWFIAGSLALTVFVTVKAIDGIIDIFEQED